MSTKYKTQVIRLTEMLEKTFEELQLSKKKEYEIKNENDLLHEQLHMIKGENEKLKMKVKELKKNRDASPIKSPENKIIENNEHDGAIILTKLKSYTEKVLQVFKETEKYLNTLRKEALTSQSSKSAFTQIEKAFYKSSQGVIKYGQQCVKNNVGKQLMKLEIEKLEVENKSLFQLTAKLQQNFKENDKLLKQYGVEMKKIADKNEQLKEQNQKLKQELKQGAKQQKIEPNAKISQLQYLKLQQKVRKLEIQNSTIKNIHHKTMKKLQSVQNQEEERQENHIKSSRQINHQTLIFQDQKKAWMTKNDELYSQIKKLSQDLYMAENSQKKLLIELKETSELYSQLEDRFQQKCMKIEEMGIEIQTYLSKLEELQTNLAEKREQIDLLTQKFEISESEKQKIVSVYQNQVQQANDKLFRKKDIIMELEIVINNEQAKLQQKKKEIQELQKIKAINEQKYESSLKQIQLLKQSLKQKEISLKNQQKQFAKHQKINAEYQKLKDQIDILKYEKTILIDQKQELETMNNEILETQKRIKADLAHNLKLIAQKQNTFQIFKRQICNLINLKDFQDEDQLISHLKAKITQLKQQISKLKVFNSEIITSKQQFDEANAQQIEELSNKISMIRSQQQNQEINYQNQISIWKMKLSNITQFDSNELAGIKDMNDLMEIVYLRFNQTQNANLNSQNQQFQRKIAKLQEINANQSQEIRKYTDSTSKLLLEIEQIQQYFNQSSKKISENELLLQINQQSINTLQQQKAKLVNDNAMLTELVSELQKELTEIRVNHSQLQKSHQSQLLSMEECKEQTMMGEYESIKLNLEIQQKENAIESLEEQVKIMQKQVQSMKEKYESELTVQKQKNKDQSDILSNYEEQIEKLEEKCEKISKQLQLKNQKIKEIEQNNKETEMIDSLKQLNLKIQEYAKKQQQQSIKMSQLEENTQHLENIIKEKIMQCDSLRQESDSLKQDKSNLQKLLIESNLNKEKLSLNIQTLYQERQKLKDALQKIYNQLTEANSKNTSFEYKLRESQQLLTKAYDQIQNLKSDALRLQAYIQDKQSQSVSSHAELLRQVSLLSEQNVKIKDDQIKLKEIIKDYRSKDQKQKEKQTIADEFQKLNKEKRQIQFKYQQGQAKFKQILSQNSDLKNKIGLFQQNISQNKAKNEEYQRSIEELTAKIQQNESSQSKMIEEVNKLKDHLEKQSNKYCQLSDLYQNLEKKYNGLNDQYQQKIRMLGKENLQLKCQVNLYISQNEKKQHQEDHEKSIQLQVKALQTQKNELINANDALGKKINELSSVIAKMEEVNQKNKDLPLQIKQENSKKRDAQEDKYKSEIAINEQYKQILQDQNKYLKTELAKRERISLKLKQLEKAHHTLNNQFNTLQLTLKSKEESIDSLTLQIKQKVEEIVKLQRKIEGLTDQLSLQKKRVRNFEELYEKYRGGKTKKVQGQGTMAVQNSPSSSS